MIALYIAAASIVAVAVALLVARTPAKLRTADQRGITLQTLIVTAVLVLMAGAAGVVIIAITNNAQDNLEGQNTGIDSRCERWEIFDPTLEAAGRGGTAGTGGVTSSAIGCIRVCYIQSTQMANTAAGTSTRIVAADTATLDMWNLKFSRSDAERDGSASLTRREVVTGDREAGAANALVEANQRIEVATSQRHCRVWDDTTDEEVVSLRGNPL